jgi:predicted phosphate transport protein (TIGR00153 family)
MLGWFRALMPREDRFFDLFARHSQTLIAGAEALQGVLQGGENVPRYCQVIVDREHEADAITAEVLLAVRRSFITPFDRGDIKDLIQSMDDSIDQMNKTVKTIALYEVRSFEPLMREMGETVAEAARLTAEAVPLLNAVGTHAARISALTETITRVEGRSDELQERGLKTLYQAHRKGSGDGDTMAYLIGAEIYGHLEDVVDRFEDVANEISGIVIENV